MKRLSILLVFFCSNLFSEDLNIIHFVDFSEECSPQNLFEYGLEDVLFSAVGGYVYGAGFQTLPVISDEVIRGKINDLNFYKKRKLLLGQLEELEHGFFLLEAFNNNNLPGRYMVYYISDAPISSISENTENGLEQVVIDSILYTHLQEEFLKISDEKIIPSGHTTRPLNIDFYLLTFIDSQGQVKRSALIGKDSDWRAVLMSGIQDNNEMQIRHALQRKRFFDFFSTLKCIDKKAFW